MIASTRKTLEIIEGYVRSEPVDVEEVTGGPCIEDLLQEYGWGGEAAAEIGAATAHVQYAVTEPDRQSSQRRLVRAVRELRRTELVRLKQVARVAAAADRVNKVSVREARNALARQAYEFFNTLADRALNEFELTLLGQFERSLPA